MTIPNLDILDTITLASGGHTDFEEGVCLLEAASVIAGESFSDHPTCVSLVLISMGIRLNDRLPSDQRQKLKPLIPAMLGTAGDGKDEIRKYMRVDWNIHHGMPTILDALGRTAIASKLRSLPAVVDADSYQAMRTLWNTQRAEARAARDQAREDLRAGKIDVDVDADAYAYADADADADAYAHAYAYADADAYAYADADAYAYADADAYAYAYADAYAYAYAYADAYVDAYVDADVAAVTATQKLTVRERVDLRAEKQASMRAALTAIRAELHEAQIAHFATVITATP